MRKHARIVFIIAIILSLSACSTIKYVPVETIKIDTTYVSQTKIDSVYHRDSIFIEHKGDTVYLSKYKYLYKYIEKRDTLFHEKVDTVQIAYPVEAKLTKWQKIKIDISNALLIISAILTIVLCVVLYIKR